MSGVLAALIIFQTAFFVSTYLQPKVPADKIEIYKRQHLLILKNKGKVIRSYPSVTGFHDGKKERSGDMKTPEGHYEVIGKKSKSIYVHSLHINYPNSYDKKHAKRLGVDPGNEITIHGTGSRMDLQKNMNTLKNWTRGCIALHNKHIKEIFNLVAVGTAVDIYP